MPIIECSESKELHSICTVQTPWGEFVIDANKAAEAVASFLSHYSRSRAGGYTLTDRWIQENANSLWKSCVIGTTPDPHGDGSRM